MVLIRLLADFFNLGSDACTPKMHPGPPKLLVPLSKFYFWIKRWEVFFINKIKIKTNKGKKMKGKEETVKIEKVKMEIPREFLPCKCSVENLSINWAEDGSYLFTVYCGKCKKESEWLIVK